MPPMVILILMGFVGCCLGSRTTVSRTATVPLANNDAQKVTIETSLQSILSLLEENQEELLTSLSQIRKEVQANHLEIQELREDTDLILANMYRPSCQQVAEEQTESEGGSSQINQATVGVFTIKPPKFKPPTQVRCQIEDGEGWTVILSRSSGVEPFNRTFKEYQSGFGDPSREYYIGNDLLHKLTTWRPHQLRVDLEDFSGRKARGQYNVFKVGSAGENYKLTVEQYQSGDVPGDGMQVHNGMSFSTYDKDDDGNKDGNCAQLFGGGGGWWYSNCYHVLPTGKYRTSSGNAFGGISWYPWRNVKQSLKSMTMLIRPIS